MDKHILLEAYKTTKKLTGIDPSKPGNLKAVLVDDAAFSAYVTSLAESMEKADREVFKILAENTRVSLLENSMYQINPYEALTLPILRVFYPKLIAKELVTVSPMDKPESVKAFIKATFAPYGTSTSTPYPTAYNAPVTGTDISTGLAIGPTTTSIVSIPHNAYDLLGAFFTGIDKTYTHLERDFEIIGVSPDGSNYTKCSIVPAVEGQFSGSVTMYYAAGESDGYSTEYTGDSTSLTKTDVISGYVDYLNGTLTISSANGIALYARIKVTCSLEENKVNPKITLTVDKVRLYAKDRQISANWSINMEQDMRALFDVSLQAEIVNLMGLQIALDIDKEIVNALISANERLNDSTHTDIFYRLPPTNYYWGIKYWHENIIPILNVLSAQIYTDTNIEGGNTIAVNPVDAAILEDINTFTYTGTSVIDGELGYRAATLAGGKWKILTSAVVAQGTMLIVLKSPDELKSVYFYSPYVPAVLHPWPLGATPSLTILSRYATALVRQLGIATLTISAEEDPGGA